jgi:exonuclease V gamma subunit
MRLVGRLGDVRPARVEGTPEVCRVEPRRLGARQLLPHWIDLLALAGSRGTARLACCGFGDKGKLHLRSGSITREQAIAHLDTLVGWYLEGQQRPLCFLPDLALEYVDDLFGKGAAPDDALAKCNASLVADFRPRWEARDPWFRRLLAPAPHCLGELAKTSEFCRIAVDVLEPLAAILVEQKVEEWLHTRATTGGDPR